MQYEKHGKHDGDGVANNSASGQTGWLRMAAIAVMLLVAVVFGANMRTSCPADIHVAERNAPPPSPSGVGTLAELPPSPSRVDTPAEFHFDRPTNSLVDVNIGTNLNPMKPLGNNFRLLVDPLMNVCSKLSATFQHDQNVHFLCLAVANYTGVTTFRRYNKNRGVSSSLVSISEDTSHKIFKNEDATQTVMVVEALPLIRGLLRNNIAIPRLKLDMQGFDYSVLRNLEPLLQETPARIHNIKAECFYPNEAGAQIYRIDNACSKVKQYLESLGYTARDMPAAIVPGYKSAEWGDVIAYKAPAVSFMTLKEF